MFDSQGYCQDGPQGLKNKRIIIQKFRPGRSAMRWHCGLRLFFKNMLTVHMVLTQLYYTWWTNGPQITFFRVDCWKDLSYLPFENWPVCWARILCACRFLLRVFKHHWVALGAAWREIVCGDALVDDVVLQINVFLCWHPNIRNENNTKSKIRYSMIRRIMLTGFRMSHGLSVNPSSVQVIMYVFWLVPCAQHFPSCCATVCDCYWEYSLGGVGNLTRTPHHLPLG